MGTPQKPQKRVKKGVKNHSKLIKIDDKKVSKITILNGKIEFFTIFHLIETKSDKKWPKIDQNLGVKIVIKFDYQKGDSGSAGLLEEKCVIIGALKFDTNSDTKLT